MMGLARHVDRWRDLQRNPWKLYIAKNPPPSQVVVSIWEGKGITIIPRDRIAADLLASPPTIRIMPEASAPADPGLARLTAAAQRWRATGGKDKARG